MKKDRSKCMQYQWNVFSFISSPHSIPILLRKHMKWSSIEQIFYKRFWTCPRNLLWDCFEWWKSREKIIKNNHFSLFSHFSITPQENRKWKLKNEYSSVRILFFCDKTELDCSLFLCFHWESFLLYLIFRNSISLFIFLIYFKIVIVYPAAREFAEN